MKSREIVFHCKEHDVVSIGEPKCLSTCETMKEIGWIEK